MSETTTHVLLPELKVPGHLLWRAAARVTATAAAQLPPEVDVHAYAVLLALKGDAVRSQQDLADCTAVSRTTMTKVAGQLAADGLVERVRNPADRRSYALTRTSAGARAEAEWRPLVLGLERAAAPSLDQAALDGLRELLRRVVAPHLSGTTPEDLLRAVGFLVVKAHALMHRDVLAALAPTGLEPRHLGASFAVRALGPVPQVDLARTLGVTPASTVQIVDDMERLGLVVRRRDDADRRTQLVSVADGSDALLQEAGRLAGEVVDDLLGDLDAAEQEQLVELLARLVTAP